jgi:penicillin-binding protein 1A
MATEGRAAWLTAARRAGERHLPRILRVGIGVVALACGLLGALVAYAAVTLPDVDGIGRATGTVRIVDRHGQPIAEFDSRNLSRRQVPLQRIAPIVREATIAAEDRQFYEEGALNVRRVLRALYVDILARRPEQGASTITQQLARLAFLDPSDKSVLRKLREALLANQLDARYGKDEILDMYLNLIYYGHGAYGIENAAQTYFGRHAADLDLSEASLLAGLPQAPSTNDPFENPQAAFARQHYVLAALLHTGNITAAQADAADPLVGAPTPTAEQQVTERDHQRAVLADLRNGRSPSAQQVAPHFAQYVRDQLQERFANDPNLLNRSVVVTTTLDLSIQRQAEDAVRSGVSALGHGADNGALLMVDAATGDIISMVGSADYQSAAIGGQYNVTTAERRPGSTFKPFVYGEAFREGVLTPDSMLDDTSAESRRLGGVQDFDGAFLGRLSADRALLLSRNVPAEQAMARAGVAQVVDFAHQLGIGSTLAPNLTTAIGSSRVRMIDEAAAYAAFANGGHRVAPRVILRVVDGAGNVLLDDSGPPTLGRVMSVSDACQVTGVLRDYPREWGLAFDRPTAGKSGTTDNFVDAWYVAYTRDLVVTTWAGHTEADSPAEVGMDSVYGTMVGQAITVPFVNALPATVSAASASGDDLGCPLSDRSDHGNSCGHGRHGDCQEQPPPDQLAPPQNGQGGD